MAENQYGTLTTSSKRTLAWACTPASHQASTTKKNSSDLITSEDLLLGAFLAHPHNFEPLPVQHFPTSTNVPIGQVLATYP